VIQPGCGSTDELSMVVELLVADRGKHLPRLHVFLTFTGSKRQSQLAARRTGPESVHAVIPPTRQMCRRADTDMRSLTGCQTRQLRRVRMGDIPTL
jgi:hypothetical protein